MTEEQTETIIEQEDDTNDPKAKLKSMGKQMPKDDLQPPPSNEVAVKNPLMSGGAIKPIVPQSMEDAYRIAVAVVQAQMTPYGIKTPQQALVAIMQGMEVGMTPMQSIQRIAVIGGRPTIWGDAAIGLVRASGKMASIREWIEGEDEDMVAFCEVRRTGEDAKVTASFSVQDAITAGLWNKRGRNGEPTPWITYPKRMLQMRARGFALRDTFADVLGGMYLREELEDEAREMKDITPPDEPDEIRPTNDLPAQTIYITPSQEGLRAQLEASGYKVEVHEMVPATAKGLDEDDDPKPADKRFDDVKEQPVVKAEAEAAAPDADAAKDGKNVPASQKARKAPRKAATKKATPARKKAKPAAEAPDTQPDEVDFAERGKEARKQFWKAKTEPELFGMWKTLVEPADAWPEDEYAPVERTYKERMEALRTAS